MTKKEYSEKCYRVFSSVFGDVLSKERFYHKHFGNPNQQETPIRVCIKDNQFVGINAFMKVDILDNSAGKNVIHSVSQSNDTAVLKEYRGQHIFSDLITEELMKHETEYIIGIPNDNSYPGFNKMGWSKVAEFTNYFYPFRLFKLLIGNNAVSRILDFFYQKMFLHKFLSAKSNVHEIQISDRLELSDEEWTEVNNSFEVGFRRYQEYIDWKTIGNGVNPKAIILRDNGALIGFVIFHIDRRFKGLSARIDDFYEKEGYCIWNSVYRTLYNSVDMIEDPLVNCDSRDKEKLIAGGMKDIRKIDKKKKKQKLIVSPNGKEEEYIRKLQMRMIDFDTYLNH